MLSSLFKEPQAKQQYRKDLLEKRQSEAIAAANTLTHAIVDSLNLKIGQAYANQRRLDAEARKLQTNAGTLAKQTAQWLQLIENFNQALKEIGDVENWAKTIESDMQLISKSLELAYKAHQEAR